MPRKMQRSGSKLLTGSQMVTLAEHSLTASSYCKAFFNSQTLCREQDAIESGLIKKVTLRKSDSGIIPADGDLVRSCRLPWGQG